MPGIGKGKRDGVYLLLAVFVGVSVLAGLLWVIDNQRIDIPQFNLTNKIGSNLVAFDLYPLEPEVIKISFTRPIDPATLNSASVRLFAISVSAGTAGERQEVPGIVLNYAYDSSEKLLTITPVSGIIGGCAACYYELELTDKIKDLRGNPVEPRKYSQMTVNN